jgi:CubicO group peptidase (beta-lactamase class C family)
MTLPIAAPKEVGLDAQRLAIADELVQGGVANGGYPAAVLLVARHGRVAHLRAFGTIGEGRPAQPDTLFDLASLTKPVVATALLTLVEDGKAVLGQTVEEWLPEAKGTAFAPLTIRQLATHTSGLPAWKPLYKVAGGRDAILADLFATPLHHKPDTRYTYSDLGYITLGEIVARASGMPLEQYLHARIFAPLHMKDTDFRPPKALHSRIAPTANEQSRPGQTMLGEVHDGNAHALGGVSGHAGLFGTAPDLSILAAALTGSGAVKDYRLLGLPTLRLARTSQSPPGIEGHSIGWFTAPNDMLPRGDLWGPETFGHTGFTGTMITCDPTYDVSVILLTNRVMNPEDNGGMSRVRRRVLNTVASAIVK